MRNCRLILLLFYALRIEALPGDFYGTLADFACLGLPGGFSRKRILLPTILARDDYNRLCIVHVERTCHLDVHDASLVLVKSLRCQVLRSVLKMVRPLANGRY